MKKLHACLFFILMSLFPSLSEAGNADSVLTQKPYQKIILDNSPIRMEERIDKKNTPKLKEFIHYISPEEMEKGIVLFYELENKYDYNPLFPRFVKYLLEDGNVKKIYTVQNTMALLVNSQFDIANFEENAKRIGLTLTKSSKENFLKQ